VLRLPSWESVTTRLTVAAADTIRILSAYSVPNQNRSNGFAGNKHHTDASLKMLSKYEKPDAG